MIVSEVLLPYSICCTISLVAPLCVTLGAYLVHDWHWHTTCNYVPDTLSPSNLDIGYV